MLCVYQIENIITKNSYIGSTKNFVNRKSSHKFKLRRGIHGTELLQEEWNEYGENSFHFLILKQIENKNELLKLEV